MATSEDYVACQPCFIKGNVTFGKGCIIHPSASIIADNGPIIIGDYNIIEERTLIQNKGVREVSGQFTEATLEIGNFNLFEIESTIEYCKIGDCNKFEHKCHVENGGVIGNGCILGALSKVSAKSHIEDQSCVYGQGKVVKNLNFVEDMHKAEIIALSDVLKQKMKKVQKK